MKKWLVSSKKADFKRIAQQYGIDQVTARCLVNRGIKEDEIGRFLHPKDMTLYDGKLLKGALEAAELLLLFIQSQKRIRVIGDYDVDGIFSTFILKKGIERVGGLVDYDIPHRMKDGYGLNARICEKAINDGVDLVITCDNGIKAFDEIDLLKKAGITVIVTDHHELDFTQNGNEKEYRIPNADVVVNPHQPDCSYPFPDICGAVVAWKVVGVLFEKTGIDKKEFEAMLPGAAFATICDIMPLVDENRCIVARGLEALGKTDNIGMRALIEDRGKSDVVLNAFDIGFVFGPCFNACGRLDTAKTAVELLEETSVSRAVDRARQMTELNEKRKAMTEEATRKALDYLDGREPDPVIVVYIPELHESLAGIVAGRVREKYYRPVFILCDGEKMVKGSGRSIPGYPMAERLHEVEDLLDHYGGHPMAAGLSLQNANVDKLRKRLIAGAKLTKEDLTDKLMIDVPMPVSYLTEELVNELARLEPFGEGNERPVFAEKDLRPYRMMYIGRTERKFLKFLFRMTDGKDIEAVYFGDSEAFVAYLESKFGEKEVKALLDGRPNEVSLTFTYYPQINEYRGNRSLQIRIEEYR